MLNGCNLQKRHGKCTKNHASNPTVCFVVRDCLKLDSPLPGFVGLTPKECEMKLPVTSPDATKLSNANRRPST